MSVPGVKSWLTWYAAATAAATLALICVGGLVTSHGVGLSVPDWPTTYGYNMFFFPISKWVGGIFYEHTHRLVASGVGLMTVGLTVWLLVAQPSARLRWMGMAALIGVVGQGVLGGLRVTELMDELGVVHATLAQLFLVLVAVIALFSSGWWQRLTPAGGATDGSGRVRLMFSLATVCVFVQLVIGAVMRHQHAGLAIPDFPTAYGGWWPKLDAESVARYNALRPETTALNPITAFGIGLQMVHRFMAAGILGAVIGSVVAAWRAWGGRGLVTRGALVWLSLIVGQAALGGLTIWTDKSADIATAHVGVGALSLVAGTLLTLVVHRLTARSDSVRERHGLGAAVGLQGPAREGMKA